MGITLRGAGKRVVKRHPVRHSTVTLRGLESLLERTSGDSGGGDVTALCTAGYCASSGCLAVIHDHVQLMLDVQGIVVSRYVLLIRGVN